MTTRLTERGIIEHIRRLAGAAGPGVETGIGDDCAVLGTSAGAKLLATTDLLLEDVHFRRTHSEPADIGWKAIAVNLSDIASMGGVPRWALIALACPADTCAEDIQAFYGGALELTARHAVQVVGGDTAASPSGWVISVAALGEARRPILRSTARAGDAVAVTGPLGRSAAGLAVLEHGAAPSGLPAGVLADVTAAHRRPEPRVREGRWLGETDAVTAMIDLSDGLSVDLRHISEESGLGARVELHAVPVTAATRQVADALGADARAWATGGGEDYELLLTCRPEAFDALSDGLERSTGTRLHRIGAMTSGAGVLFVDRTGREVTVAPGFQHFAGERSSSHQ